MLKGHKCKNLPRLSLFSLKNVINGFTYLDVKLLWEVEWEGI